MYLFILSFACSLDVDLVVLVFCFIVVLMRVAYTTCALMYMAARVQVTCIPNLKVRNWI